MHSQHNRVVRSNRETDLFQCPKFQGHPHQRLSTEGPLLMIDNDFESSKGVRDRFGYTTQSSAPVQSASQLLSSLYVSTDSRALSSREHGLLLLTLRYPKSEIGPATIQENSPSSPYGLRPPIPNGYIGLSRMKILKQNCCNGALVADVAIQSSREMLIK